MIFIHFSPDMPLPLLFDAIRHSDERHYYFAADSATSFRAFSATAPFRRHCQPLADSHAISPPFHYCFITLIS
jgi:hypothetical protein